MIRLFLLYLICCSWDAQAQGRRELGSLVLDGIPEIPKDIAERLERFQNVRSAAFAGWLPGARGTAASMLIQTRFAETAQVHQVQMPMGMRRQITFFKEPVQGLTLPDTKTIPGFIFSMDKGGSENYQLYYYDFSTKEHRMLTDGASRNGSAVFSRDGKRFAYFSTKRNGRDCDIYIDSLMTAKPELVYQAEGSFAAVAFAPDDKVLLLSKYVSSTESYYYLLDLATKTTTQILPAAQPFAFGGAVFSRDGKAIYFTSDQDAEFMELRLYNRATKAQRRLSSSIPWDVEGLELSHDGKTLLFTINEGGLDALYSMDTRTERFAKVPGIPRGSIGGLSFSPDDKNIALTLASAISVADVFVMPRKGGKLTRWTESEIGGLDTSRFVEPELVSFPTFDNDVSGKPRQIPAFMYLPKEKPGRNNPKVPVIIDIHGGPEGQAQPAFSGYVQYLVGTLGFAYVQPNVRGSSGYGKSYLLLDNGFKREDSVKDIGALIDYLCSRPDIDSSRIAVAGGSYGGFMSLASMVKYGDRLAAGIDVVGISSFVTFLKNTAPYRQDLRRAEYGDERDPKMYDFLQRISPLSQANILRKPMLVAQGLNDPRVPASEAEQIVAAIRKNKGEAWYFLAKDEGHGFQKKGNRDAYQQIAIMFLQRVLGGQS